MFLVLLGSLLLLSSWLYVEISCGFRFDQVDKMKAVEAAAAAASVRRLYRVREEAGVEATRTPDIVAPAVDLIEAGTAFYGKAEVCLVRALFYVCFLCYIVCSSYRKAVVWCGVVCALCQRVLLCYV